MTTQDQLKENIADKYLQNFKKELNFFEKMMIAPISSKMKDILKSENAISVNKLEDLSDLWFWRKVLWVKIFDKQIFESLVNKTFKFLKEKQEKIIKAQTCGKLEELQNLVINGKLDELESVVSGTTWSEWSSESGSSENSSSSSSDWNNSSWSQSDPNSSNAWNDNNWNWNWNTSTQTNEWSNNNWDISNSIENWNNSQEWWVDAVQSWVAVWVWWSAAYLWWLKQAEKSLWINVVDKVPEWVDKDFSGTVKKSMRKIQEELQDKIDNGNLNRAKKYTYKKSLSEFKKAEEALWNPEAVDAFKAWQLVWDRLPPDFLKTLKVDKNVLKAIENLSDYDLLKLTQKSSWEIVEFFSGKWIKISEKFADYLKLAKNAWEIRAMTKVLKNWTKVANIVKWIKWMWVLTFLFAWFDVWAYIEWNKEAELVKKVNEIRWNAIADEASWQLYIGVWWVLLEAAAIAWCCIAWCSVVGPIWTAIWVGVWIICGAASMITSSYYESKEFYAQNRYDFINKKRTNIKQSIVQLFESDRLWKHSWYKEDITKDRWTNSEINTMEDAWEALIYQEEIINWSFYRLQVFYNSWQSESEFLKTLSEEDKKQYEEEKKNMENIIKTRMEYVKPYITEQKNTEQYNKLKTAISKSNGIWEIEQILADSAVYYYLHTEHDDSYVDNYKSLNIDDYKKAYENKLKSEYPSKFKIFEELRKTNPTLLQEICDGVSSTKYDFLENFKDSEKCEFKDEEKNNIKRNIEFITKYSEFLNLWRPIEKKISLNMVSEWIDEQYIEQILIDINSVNKRPTESQNDKLKRLSYRDTILKNEYIDNLVSDRLFQNILYSIAVECHWYSWRNNVLELSKFFCDDKDHTWIYIDDHRRINDDWYWDFAVDPLKMESMTTEQIVSEFTNNLQLDSEVEIADDTVTNEFKNKVKKIIEKECLYRTNKKTYETEIVNFIKNSCNGTDWYVELPLDLVIKAKKSWIWNIQNYVFSVKSGEISALCRWDNVEGRLNFEKTNTSISYEAMNKLRSSLTEEEKSVISDVKKAHDKLESIRAVVWNMSGHTDELDLPVEFERNVLSKKRKEWQDFEKSLYYMQPSCKTLLEEKAKEFYNFFEWIYTWMLTRITSYSTSDDIDSVWKFLQAASYSQWFDVVSVEKWEVKINDNYVHKSISSYLIQLLDYYKDSTTWKSVKELLLKEDTAELWKQLAKQIYIICLEQAVIEKDSNWNVSGFSVVDMSKSDFEKVKQNLNAEMKKYSFNSDLDKLSESWDKIKSTVWGFSVREVYKAENEAHENVVDVNKLIINTLPDVDWEWRRWKITFESNEKQDKPNQISWTLKSRWYSEKVIVHTKNNNKEIDWVEIEWLTKRQFWKFPTKEWFQTANLINYIKKNKKDNPKWTSVPNRPWWSFWDYERDGWELQRNTSSINDITILEEDTVKKNFPKIMNTNEFLEYINKDEL